MKSDALLIFDFDNTITNGHMHNAFFRLGKNDFNTAAKYAVTNDDISNFLENTGGIKNEKKLKTALLSAFLGGIEVSIASYTGYPNAVKKVVEDYLELPKEQVSIFGGFPKDYDVELPKDIKEQQSKVGKNLHICKAIVEYKNKYGNLPKTVMLVDDSIGNIRKIDEFTASLEEEWLERNGLNFEDIKNIKFEGVQVPKEDKNINYLEKVEEFISANSVQEHIYENLKKKEPIYQNLQDIKTTEPIYKNTEDISSPSPVPPKPQYPHAAASHDSIGQNKEENIYTKKSTISLAEGFKTIKSFFADCGQSVVNAICSVFKKIVMIRIEEQGYRADSEKGKSEITIHSDKPIDTEKIKTDAIDTSLIKVMELDEKEIRSLGDNYKGVELKQEISKLLNVDLQEKDANSPSISRSPLERQAPSLPPKNHAERVIQSRNTANNAAGKNC